MADVNRQRFALDLGLAVVAFHIIFTLLMWFVIAIPGDRVAIKEIATPVTIGYAVAVVKYFIDVKGLVQSDEVIGIRLAVLTIGLVGAFIVSLVAAPFIYLNNAAITPDQLNGFFVAVESAFGALLALLFSFLYKMSP
ncbi:MAG: hypothetical protein ABL879_14970 [Devosia sp.]